MSSTYTFSTDNTMLRRASSLQRAQTFTTHGTLPENFPSPFRITPRNELTPVRSQRGLSTLRGHNCAAMSTAVNHARERLGGDLVHSSIKLPRNSHAPVFRNHTYTPRKTAGNPLGSRTHFTQRVVRRPKNTHASPPPRRTFTSPSPHTAATSLTQVGAFAYVRTQNAPSYTNSQSDLHSRTDEFDIRYQHGDAPVYEDSQSSSGGKFGVSFDANDTNLTESSSGDGFGRTHFSDSMDKFRPNPSLKGREITAGHYKDSNNSAALVPPPFVPPPAPAGKNENLNVDAARTSRDIEASPASPMDSLGLGPAANKVPPPFLVEKLQGLSIAGKDALTDSSAGCFEYTAHVQTTEFGDDKLLPFENTDLGARKYSLSLESTRAQTHSPPLLTLDRKRRGALQVDVGEDALTESSIGGFECTPVTNTGFDEDATKGNTIEMLRAYHAKGTPQTPPPFTLEPLPCPGLTHERGKSINSIGNFGNTHPSASDVVENNLLQLDGNTPAQVGVLRPPPFAADQRSIASFSREGQITSSSVSVEHQPPGTTLKLDVGEACLTDSSTGGFQCAPIATDSTAALTSNAAKSNTQIHFPKPSRPAPLGFDGNPGPGLKLDVGGERLTESSVGGFECTAITAAQMNAEHTPSSMSAAGALEPSSKIDYLERQFSKSSLASCSMSASMSASSRNTSPQFEPSHSFMHIGHRSSYPNSNYSLESRSMSICTSIASPSIGPSVYEDKPKVRNYSREAADGSFQITPMETFISEGMHKVSSFIVLFL